MAHKKGVGSSKNGRESGNQTDDQKAEQGKRNDP